jgi:hypothetical protein
MRTVCSFFEAPLVLGVCSALGACVSEQAGYDDVRSLTAERLGQSARWHADAERSGIEAESHQLLDQPIDADTAARIAVLNSPLLQASFEKLGVARAELRHALRLPNPHVGGALRYGPERPEVELEAMIPLSEFLFLPSRDDVGSAGLDASAFEVAGLAVDVAFDARAAFYEYQLAEQSLELSRATLGSLWAASAMAEQLARAGNVTELARASEQVAYEEARLDVTRAEARVFERREALNRVLGLFGRDAALWKAQPLSPEVAPSDALTRDVESRAVAASLDLAMGQRRLDQARERASLARAEGWVPELKAGVSAERAEEGWGVGPAAEVELPLFYQGQGETGRALAAARQQQRMLAHTAVAVRATARSLATRLSAAEQSLGFYEGTVLPLRTRVVEQAQLQYNAMQIGVFQLLQAKRDATLAEQKRLALLGEYWATRNELERLLAGKLGSELPSAPPTAPAGAGDMSSAGH